MQPHEGGAPSGTSGELQVGQGRAWAIFRRTAWRATRPRSAAVLTADVT